MTAEILRTRDVLRLLGISRATLYVGMRAGIYPKPIRLTPKGHNCYWPRETIQAVIEKATQPQ
jgi:predicted DNA-binding transcriptional regulator AlpA